MLTEEQAEQIKQQLLSQIDKFPEEQRESLKEQIEEMNAQELEEFLIKNKMIRTSEGGGGAGGEGGEASGGKQECIFCSIIQNKIPSYKLGENKKSLAILEINPLSKGHSLVLSREHKKLPSSAFVLASKLAKKIKTKLKADDVKIENAEMMGHQTINIIPIYKDQKLEKKKADEKELILLQDKLTAKQKKKEEATKPKIEEKQESKSLPKAPRRIP